ncbi:hypothetical protein GRI75_02120 [Altererythrobacter soli]|uniref:GlsB/YeaQ/YmgE family stress response membrane protein n=1 Tax=Croceibacterium soli TaxID=1739690 RepID=A0A6I4UNB7_9SPHN|nr:hypothetical protein [Croceibacterium soli]MXP40441.1 hypothetical protein [Croceibacterium soli]
MSVLLMIVVGAVLGWVMTVILQIQGSRGALTNIAGGVAGALLAGLLLGPLLGRAALWAGEYRLGSLLLPLLGAAVLVVALNLLHKRPVR